MLSRNHPFAEGLALGWPEGKAAAGKIVRNHGQFLLIANQPRSYGDHILAIANDDDGFDHGVAVGRFLRKLSKRASDPALKQLSDEIEYASLLSEIPIHWKRPSGLFHRHGKSAPVMRIEYTHIDDALMTEIRAIEVAHDDVPHDNVVRIPCNWVMVTRGLRQTFTEQAQLQKQRKEQGLLIDPMLLKYIDKQTLKEVLKRTKWKNPSKETGASFDPLRIKRHLAIEGIRIPYAIEAIKVMNGILYCEIRLDEKIVWNGGLKNKLVIKDMRFPESQIINREGKKLKELVDHPYFDDAWTIESIEENDPIEKVLNGDATNINVNCDLIAEKSIFPD